MTTITKEIVIVLIECATCHINFGIEQKHQTRLQGNGETFFCPSGHKNWYGKSETDKLRRELRRANEQSEYWRGVAEAESHAKNGMKGAYQKTKNELDRTRERIVNGACPCCHRQFVNLQRHMSGKHPEYKSDGNS